MRCMRLRCCQQGAVAVRCMRVVCALYAILFDHQVSTASWGTLYARCMCVVCVVCDPVRPPDQHGESGYVVCALYALCALGILSSRSSGGALYALGILYLRCMRCMRLGFYMYVVCLVYAWDFIWTLYALYARGVSVSRERWGCVVCAL